MKYVREDQKINNILKKNNTFTAHTISIYINGSKANLNSKWVISLEILSGPEVKELDERTVAYVSFVGNYMGNTGVFEELINKLCGWAGPRQLFGPDTVFISAYYDDPGVTPPEKLRLGRMHEHCR